MREISFRAKDENNKWTYCDFDDPLNLVWCHYDKNLAHFTKQIIKNTLGQYTGCKDKNGTKIFEGDIVKYTRTNMQEPTMPFHGQDIISLHVISYDKEKCVFIDNHYILPEKVCFTYGLLNFYDERAEENIIEVVGNIYDDPDMITDVRVSLLRKGLL